MENQKTISYLNTKAWYRALKVIYTIFAVFFILYAIGGGLTLIYIFIFNPAVLSIVLSTPLRIVLGILAIPVLFSLTWLILQLPKWIFYYIYLGTRIPKE